MSFIDKVWYRKLNVFNAPVIIPLLPFSCLFSIISKFRRESYKTGKRFSLKVKPFVIVVGGIAVGGTGKTPLCISLLKKLDSLGYKVGLLSRGYKGKAISYPYTVTKDSDVNQSGDEPLLIKLSVGDAATVVVDPNRERGAQYLEHLGVDIIVTDDGLQHYSLQRDFEIIVIDGKRMLGNGFLLPAGPLREGRWRLKTADLVVTNGESSWDDKNIKIMQLIPSPAMTLSSFCNAQKSKDTLQKGTSVIALAGIGNPTRFYNTLQACGYIIEDTIDIGDHGVVDKDILKRKSKELPIVMTAKDAVKYADYHIDNLYVLNVEAVLSDGFYKIITDRLNDFFKIKEN